MNGPGKVNENETEWYMEVSRIVSHTRWVLGHSVSLLPLIKKVFKVKCLLLW